MLEVANVVSVDKLQEFFAERMRQIEEGKQHLAKLEQEANTVKSNLIAIDGAAQQLRLLIDMCNEPLPPPAVTEEPTFYDDNDDAA